MSNISYNGIITLMRGDSFSMPIRINLGTNITPYIYKLESNDKLYFALMEPNQAFEDAVMKKVYTHLSDTDEDGNILLVIDPKDTEQLLVGKYYYMIKLRMFVHGKEVVKTIIPPTLFWLQGNNPKPMSEGYVDKNPLDIDHLIYNGEKIEVDDSTEQIHTVYDGGLIT